MSCSSSHRQPHFNYTFYIVSQKARGRTHVRALYKHDIINTIFNTNIINKYY